MAPAGGPATLAGLLLQEKLPKMGAYPQAGPTGFIYFSASRSTHGAIVTHVMAPVLRIDRMVASETAVVAKR